MNRSALVRFQVFLLVLVGVLVVWRPWLPGAGPEHAIELDDLKIGSLYEQGFQMAESAEVRIETLYSVEEAGSEVAASYPWIIDAQTRDVVWSAEGLQGEKDQTRIEAVDSLVMEAGTYEVYFATYGPTIRSRTERSFLGLRPHWTNDKDRWYLRLAAPAEAVLTKVEPEVPERPALWASGPMGNRESRSTTVHMAQDGELFLQATGEVCSSGCDIAWIEDVVEGERIWEMNSENTERAGGMASNRSFDGTVALPAGVYRVGFESDASHAYQSWRGNPPYDPASWGVRVSGNPTVVQRFEPWETEDPVTALSEIGDNEVRSKVFRVTEPLSVVVSAMGEIGDGGTLYDYAWIERGQEREKIWVMSRDRSDPAGGSSTNRKELAFLALEPGTYGLYYQSDGSHSWPDFRNGTPEHSERWGVTLFAVDGDAARSGWIEVLEEAPISGGGHGPTAPLPTMGEAIMDVQRVGNHEDLRAGFTLDRPTRLKIIAMGEMSQNGRYDYGWIQSASGDYVWEMTLQNTTPAGGSDRNRLFEGTITLPEGVYEAHYTSDFSHSYGDFGDGAPARSERWGMRIIPVVE